MPTFSAVDCPKDLECAICLEPWVDPVELAPCKHVFCKNCVASVQNCPECRKKISGRNNPNRILVNMAAEVKLMCSDCGWKGVREASPKHVCGGPGAGGPTFQGSAGSPSVVGAGYQQQPQAHTQPASQQSYGGYGGYGGPAAPAPAGRTAVAFSQPAQAPAIIPIHQGGNEPWHQYSLTQMEYDQIFCIFLHFDADGSGELDKRELKKLARWLNFAHTDQDIDHMFRQMDTDGSGSLSLEEFCTWLKYNKPDPTSLYGMTQSDYNYVLMQFHHYDADSTGELDLRQFVELCTSSNLCSSRQEAEMMFRQIDLDRSGTVDLHEFLTFRANQNPHAQQHGPQATGVYLGSSQSGGSYGNPAPQQSSGAYNHPQTQQSSGNYGGASTASRPTPPPQSASQWRGPPNWERAVAPDGKPYYIDHNTKSTHWNPPAGYQP